MRAAALPPLPADFPIRAIAPGAIGRQSGEDVVNRDLGPEPGRQPGKMSTDQFMVTRGAGDDRLCVTCPNRIAAETIAEKLMRQVMDGDPALFEDFYFRRTAATIASGARSRATSTRSRRSAGYPRSASTALCARWSFTARICSTPSPPTARRRTASMSVIASAVVGAAK